MKSKVALIRCENYDYANVKAAVERGIELIGGPLSIAKPDEKILLKPNWIMAVPPERCATTHPSVFKAVGELFLKAGVKLSYRDSPGFSKPEKAADKTGFHAVASELGIPLADFETSREVDFEEAIQNKKFFIANSVLESDGIISLPKLKTQALMKLTGAVKNQLGCVPGMKKGEYHLKLPKSINFGRMLVDLDSLIKPRLYIMDGIMAMEGNGPMSGDPVKMNVLLFSTDPIALDATVCRMINVDPEYSYTVTEGMKSGRGTYLEEEIELFGDPLSDFINPDFNVSRGPVSNTMVGGPVVQFFNNIINNKPLMEKGKCKKCGICINVCPVKPKAIDWNSSNKTEPPVYNYNNCIRCFCCQEVCPEGAIRIKTPILRKIFTRS